LSNGEKRAQYDRFGHAGMGGQGGFGGGGMNMDDIFSQFGDIFGGAFGGSLVEAEAAEDLERYAEQIYA
jgi:molecular chaperone DnaJ